MRRLLFFSWLITTSGGEYFQRLSIFELKVQKNVKLFSRSFVPEAYQSDLYYLIVFVDAHDRFKENALDNIFIDSYKKAVLNVNILFPYTNESMMMTTYIPFEQDCVKLTRRDLGVLCESNFELGESLADVFPKKGLNMNKCTLNVATFPSEPLVIVRWANDTTNDIVVEGIEVDILLQMAKTLNFNIRFKSPADKQKRGVIGANGTSSGCFKMVSHAKLSIYRCLN